MAANIPKEQAVQIALNGTDEEVNKQLRQYTDVDRRVVSRKETVGYILFTSFRDFNINGHKDIFAETILKISLNLQSVYNAFAGVWDIVDDIIIGGVVEKTRTRWGKFIPYMAMSGIPLAIMSVLYWMLPYLIGQENCDNLNYLPKFLIWAALELINEVVENFRNVSVGGYMSTVTPYPTDRRRLISISSYASIIFSRLPDLVIEFAMDFITNGLVKTAKSSEQALKKAFVILGPSTMVVSAIIITWYCSIAKERVHQKIETPKIRESLRIVFTNKPLLAKMIADAFGSFGTGVSTNDYYRYVLYMTTFETIAGIPSVFFQPFGFAKYNELASKYSTKSLYMVSQVFAKTFYIPIWIYGRFLKTKGGKYFFQSRVAMLPVTAVWECIYATFWGVKSISGNEISNECNDYIEWKYGQRNEATLSVASTIICKIPARLNGIIQPQFKRWIGYDQTAYAQAKPQTFRAQKWLFAFATIITSFTVLGSMIPMFWYNIDKETRDRMYRELNERRVKIAEKINAADDGIETQEAENNA
ncbi:MAG: MFS transporter [Clostridia bacterium]|nr:MFS transporter [Clostridia bacterium]